MLADVVMDRDCLTLYIEGSRPEWCISSMIYSRDTPFWSGTLDIILCPCYMQLIADVVNGS